MNPEMGKGTISITDEEFFTEWLNFAFEAKKLVFDILVEQYALEDDLRLKSLLCSQIFSTFQAQIEDLALLMSALEKKASETRKKSNSRSLFYTLLKMHTDQTLLDDLENLTNTINPNGVLERLGLPLIDKSGGEFWGYKPGEFYKHWGELQEKLQFISTSVSKLNKLGRRIGNKVKHFGFFRELSDGRFEVFVDIIEKDRGVTVWDEKIEIMREGVGSNMDAYRGAFDVARELIAIFINVYLESMRQNRFAQRNEI